EERREDLLCLEADIDAQRIRGARSKTAGAGAATVSTGGATAGTSPILAQAIATRGHRGEGSHIARGSPGRLLHAGEIPGFDVVLSTVLHACARGVRDCHGRIEDATKIEDDYEEHEREREHEHELRECYAPTPHVVVSMRHATPSFGERDRPDRRPAGEILEVVVQAAGACKPDPIGDEDGVGGSAGDALAPREFEASRREVERPFQSEGAATVHRAVSAGAADRPILEKEHRLHGTAPGGGERSGHATVDGHGAVGMAGAYSVVEGDTGAVDHTPAHREATSVEDVETGLERHHNNASPTDGDGGVEAVTAVGPGLGSGRTGGRGLVIGG